MNVLVALFALVFKIKIVNLDLKVFRKLAEKRRTDLTEGTLELQTSKLECNETVPKLNNVNQSVEIITSHDETVSRGDVTPSPHHQVTTQRGLKEGRG